MQKLAGTIPMRAGPITLLVLTLALAMPRPAAALDPPTALAFLTCDGKRAALAYVQAVESPDDPASIWVWLTNQSLAAVEARNLWTVQRRANDRGLRGVVLVLPNQPKEEPPVSGFVFAGTSPVKPMTIAPGARWDRLVVKGRRVAGTSHIPTLGDGPAGCSAWSLDVQFTAPVFAGP